MASPIPLRPLTHSLIPRRPITDSVATLPQGISESDITLAASIIDPCLFFQQYLDVDLWSTQREMLQAIVTNPRVAVKSCHASSKTFSAGRLVLWWLARHQEAVVVTTGPSWHQIETQLWGEVHAAWLKCKLPGFPKPNLTELKISSQRIAYGLSTSVTKQDEGVKIQGIHGKNVLVIIDEAPGLNPKIWEAIEGARAGGNVRVLALGNPTIASGPFHSAFVEQRSGWKTFTIDAFETPNFAGLAGGLDFLDKDGKLIQDESSKLWNLLQMADSNPELLTEENEVCPYLITRRWVVERYYEWGLDHPSWQSRVRGQFPKQAADALISLAWLEEQKNRVIQEKATDEIVAGLDVASVGEDETSLTIRRGSKIIFHDATAIQDPRGWVMEKLLPYKGNLKCINVDVIGVGYNMFTHLKDTFGERTNPVNVCNTANDTEKYADLKSEYYWGLRMRLQQGDFCGLQDEKTIGQLAGIKYKNNSRGQTEIESKEDARKRGVKSPDRAESIMLAFAGVTKVYGALAYYHDLEKTVQKIQQSTLVKPVTNDKTLDCSNCHAISVVITNGAYRCSNCGHNWQLDKQKLPGFTRADMLAKMGGRNVRH